MWSQFHHCDGTVPAKIVSNGTENCMFYVLVRFLVKLSKLFRYLRILFGEEINLGCSSYKYTGLNSDEFALFCFLSEKEAGTRFINL